MQGTEKAQDSIWWWEPRWSFVPRIRQEMAGLLQVKLWLRILIFSAVIIFVLALLLHWAVPGLEFDWPKAFLLSVLAGLGGLGAIIGLLLLLPPMISVNRRGISRQQGQSVHWRRRAEIRRIAVVTTTPGKPLLWVETSGQPFEAGIASQIVPSDLAAFLKRSFPELLVEEAG